MEAMNVIWGPYLKLLRQGGDPIELHYFVRNNRVSPYLELQADSLYEESFNRESFAHLDVNPYVRFFPIFDPLLTPDDLGYEEFNEALSDVLLHYLADLDLKAGMCKRDFYIEFLVSDMEQGAFGETDSFAEFSVTEKRTAAEWLLSFYRTGDGPGSLLGALRTILPSCEIFIRDGEEFIFHMREKRTEAADRKLRFLIKLFLPAPYDFVIHWIRTYGVTGYEKTMRLGGFVLA